MTDHEFSGIVYDVHAHILFANMYVYGYKKEKLPEGYESILPLPNIAEIERALKDALFDPNEEIVLKGSRMREKSTKPPTTSGGVSGSLQSLAAVLMCVFVFFRI